MPKTKKGMRSGYLQFSMEAFLQVLSKDPQTTINIAKRVQETINKEVSWNTAQKYLELLEQEGKVKHDIVGRFHIWSLV
jgi:hypothetical protein